MLQVRYWPNNGDLQSVLIVDLIAWWMDKASDPDIWRVTMPDEWTNFIVQVPDGLALHSLSYYVYAGQEWKLFKDFDGIMQLISFFHLCYLNINTIDNFQIW